jgi:uncharacterized membrane protein YedE/YeeE
MQIDWNHFTPWASLIGGILLGLAASLFILVNGRILGISGIVGGLLMPRGGDAAWRLAFVLGLVVAPAVYALVGGPVPATRYGAGCTSGHGVCGLSRLSPRSLVATLSFMGAGFAVVFVVRHLLA